MSHLIHVNTNQENIFIKDLLHKTTAGTSWLGLSDMDIEGLWKWYDSNELAGYTDWYPGQPDKGDGEDCAAFADYHSDHAYLWEDYPCDRLHHPVCERNVCAEVTDIVG
ncbi:perlucin-like [Mercenaria mercenaria]|uniref:perlucin-like n=1 Tax=Mercenaria mercenaria TaxID=6596 RepID=UPI00234E8E68|nr:perlucin-like [Mercenaria mercenaria]